MSTKSNSIIPALALFILCLFIFVWNVWEREQKTQLDRIEAKIQDISLDVEILQLDDIEIFENLRAIEQDSFYSNE